jgi:hypothetical protein
MYCTLVVPYYTLQYNIYSTIPISIHCIYLTCMVLYLYMVLYWYNTVVYNLAFPRGDEMISIWGDAGQLIKHLLTPLYTTSHYPVLYSRYYPTSLINCNLSKVSIQYDLEVCHSASASMPDHVNKACEIISASLRWRGAPLRPPFARLEPPCVRTCKEAFGLPNFLRLRDAQSRRAA